MQGNASGDPSPDELLVAVQAATTPDEIRAAIRLLAGYLKQHRPGEKLRYAAQEMMQRAEEAGVMFGRPHDDAARERG
jgi:hypothetical protein